MSDEREYRRTLREAERLPNGPVATAMFQEAVRIADRLQDEQLQFESRLELASAATFSGSSDLCLVAMGWCLSRYKEDPEKFAEHEHTLCWQLKHVLSDVTSFPQITLAQVESLFAEMESLYAMHGYNRREILDARGRFEAMRGNRDLALDYYRQSHEIPVDSMSDCAACRHGNQVWLLRFREEYAEAIAHVQPLFRRELTCTNVPAVTYSSMLEAYVHTGQLEEGDQIQALGYSHIRSNPSHLGSISDQIEYLAYRGKFRQALNIFARHLIWALQAVEQDARFSFLNGARYLFETMLATGKRSRVKLALPEQFPLHHASGEYELADLLNWVTAEAAEIAARFDARNETDAYAERLNRSSPYE